MSALVVDASVAAAWIFDDEDEPRAGAARLRVGIEEALVPQLWHLEVRNALLTAERRGRIRTDEVEDRLRSLLELPVETDTEPNLAAALALARRRQLTFYDAMYLELALRREGVLATLDGALMRAASAEGLPLVEPITSSPQPPSAS